MTRYRVTLDVDWDDPDMTTIDLVNWLAASLMADAPGTPDWVDVDRIEELGT